MSHLLFHFHLPLLHLHAYVYMYIHVYSIKLANAQALFFVEYLIRSFFLTFTVQKYIFSLFETYMYNVSLSSFSLSSPIYFYLSPLSYSPLSPPPSPSLPFSLLPLSPFSLLPLSLPLSPFLSLSIGNIDTRVDDIISLTAGVLQVRTIIYCDTSNEDMLIV